MKNSNNIKIYVVCHKDAFVPENPYLYPIQVGTALADKKLELRGILHDNEGEQISEKNKTYCELTAHYWAWKNEEADYYGFFHYRRYLAFDPAIHDEDIYGNLVYDRIDEKALKEIKLDPKVMQELISWHDIITVRGRKYMQSNFSRKMRQVNIYQEYGSAPFQHRKDLDITLQILKKKYPEFAESADEYMQSDVAYECNMFIMKKELFRNYCSWLFDILFEAEKQIDMTWYSVEEYRVMGYLAERLFGIYYTYLKKQPDVKRLEVPKTLFRDTEPRAVLEPVYDEEVPVVLSANNHFAPYLDVMVRSMVENASSNRNYDIIILHNDISERNQQLIRSAARNKEHITIRFARVAQYFDAEKFFVDQHLSVETYYRLIIPELMPNFHKILYLDCDMVADRDVAELYELDLQGAVIGAAKDIDIAGQVNLNQNKWKSYATEVLGLDSPYDYFQAGVLVLDLDALRSLTTSKKMIELACSQSFRCHDQDVLNVICKNKIFYLPQQWNTLMDWKESDRSRMQILKMAPRALFGEYTAARKEPYLIHFAGYQKPWNTVDCDFAEYFWKYARLSPYYPMLIHGIHRVIQNEGQPAPEQMRWIPKKSPLWKLVELVMPYHSKRREWVKKIFWSIKK